MGSPLAGLLVILPAQAVRVQKPVPSLAGLLRGAERKAQHAPAVVSPAAKGFKAVRPLVLVGFADGEPGQPGQIGVQSPAQCPAVPIIPRVLTIDATDHPAFVQARGGNMDFWKGRQGRFERF